MKNNYMQFGLIGVLMGGYSSERVISLKSGKAIFEALRHLGCEAVAIDIKSNQVDQMASDILEANINLAFIALHGQGGEDGNIQLLLEKMNIPYTGSGVDASRLVFDKVLTQNLLEKNGLNIPSYFVITKDDQVSIKTIFDRLEFSPIVVKPAQEGSSLGINIVREKDAMEDALIEAWHYGDQILLEQYIDGRELTVSILGTKALPVIEIIPKREFF